jgi:hypothetical protein
MRAVFVIDEAGTRAWRTTVARNSLTHITPGADFEWALEEARIEPVRPLMKPSVTGERLAQPEVVKPSDAKGRPTTWSVALGDPDAITPNGEHGPALQGVGVLIEDALYERHAPLRRHAGQADQSGVAGTVVEDESAEVGVDGDEVRPSSAERARRLACQGRPARR